MENERIDRDAALISGLDSFLPPIIPDRWSPSRVPSALADAPNQETLAYRSVLDGLLVFFSLEDHGDGGIWLHLSVSNLTGGRKPPTVKSVMAAKGLFFGEEHCVQSMPKVHKGVVHLFRRVDGDFMPPGLH